MRYVNFNKNPLYKRVGDCTVRAIATALDESWQKVYIWLCVYGFMFCDLPSANYVWGEYLKSKGFRRYVIDQDGLYTVNDFCNDNPQGLFILALQSHVICVKNGDYLDTWDSGNEIPIYYWKRKED